MTDATAAQGDRRQAFFAVLSTRASHCSTQNVLRTGVRLLQYNSIRLRSTWASVA